MDFSSIARIIAAVLSLMAVVLALMFARARGYREQAGRQDREARSEIARPLQEFKQRLEQEEIRRAAMRDGGTVAVGRELRHVDCAAHVWTVLAALANPAPSAGGGPFRA